MTRRRPRHRRPAARTAARTAASRAAARALAAVLGLAVLGAVAQVAGPQPLLAQTLRSAVLADSIRVGDVVPVAVRLTVGAGERVVLPPMLDLAGDLENAGRVRERVETLDDGRIQVTGIYTVTPWRPGPMALPDMAVQVLSATGEARTVAAALPALEVLSVLPVDAQMLEPMPARDVLGRNWAWWPFLLLALGLLLLAGALWAWLRRRRPAVAEGVTAPAVPPRAAALAALDEARAAGLLERGEWKEFYTRVSVALRAYLHAVAPEWGEDLTTTELLARVRVEAGHDAAADLAALLRPADQVKFARRTPDGPAALAEWEAARGWVERFRPPTAEEPVEAAA
jgi:hypothetical protein